MGKRVQYNHRQENNKSTRRYIDRSQKGVYTMYVVKVNKSNFENEVLNSEKKVLLDFYADWCGPCRMVGPVVEEIAKEHPEYKVCKINVDEEGELAASFQVMSIPSLFVMENGKVVKQSLGAKPKAQILDMLA